MAKVYNFSAGPCILPQEVLKEASEAVSNFDNLNLSFRNIPPKQQLCCGYGTRQRIGLRTFRFTKQRL